MEWQYIYTDAIIQNFIAINTNKLDFVKGIKNIQALINNAHEKNINLDGIYAKLHAIDINKIGLYYNGKISQKTLLGA